MRIALLAVALIACTPELDEREDTYSCARDGECPPGWSCLSDNFCAPERMSLLESCRADSDCASGVCTRGPDMGAAAALGYCSRACAGDLECTDISAEPECSLAIGQCLEECRTSTDCPADSGCHMEVEAGRRTRPRCYPLVNRGLRESPMPCTGMMGCPPPGFCARADTIGPTGLCALPCDMDVHCPEMTEPNGGQPRVMLGCLPVFAGSGACLRRCDPSVATSCGAGLVCGRVRLSMPTVRESDPFCMPEAWVGRDAPFPGGPSGGGPGTMPGM